MPYITFVCVVVVLRVFPVEACETIGGEACMAEMYPEVKLKPEASRSDTPRVASSENVDREYLDYTNDPKTYVIIYISHIYELRTN